MSRNSNLFWKIVAYLYNTTVEIQLKMKDIVIPKWLEQTFGKVFIIQIVRLLFSFVLFPSLTKSYNVCFYLISIFMQKKKKLNYTNQTKLTPRLNFNNNNYNSKTLSNPITHPLTINQRKTQR